MTVTPSRHARGLEPPRALAAERVVLQPGVADAGDEDLLLEARRVMRSLHLVGLEVQVPADVAHQLLAGVVVDGHAQVHVVVVVDVDPLDRRAAAREQVVLRVAAGAGPQDDVRAAAERSRRRPRPRSRRGTSSASAPGSRDRRRGRAGA